MHSALISCTGTYEELVVSVVKGVPVAPFVAQATAAAVLWAALNEDDDASLRSASLAKMLRYYGAAISQWLIATTTTAVLTKSQKHTSAYLAAPRKRAACAGR